jgi:aminopeptidase
MNHSRTRNKKLNKAALIIIRDCLGIKHGEKVVIITDDYCRSIGYTLWYALEEITDPILITIKRRHIHGEEPPQLVADVLRNCDVFIMPTWYSLTHTHARIAANKNGARGATMPGITVDVMARALNVDHRRITVVTKKLAILLSKAKKALITTERGTHLELHLAKRRGYIDTGIIKKPKEFSNLPAGEAYIAPQEYKSKGIIVVDGSFAPVGLLKNPVVLEINNGCLVKINGNRTLSTIFKNYGKRERILGELGIGTNPRAKITGNVLEDEKVLGSVHVAFGNNVGFGGNNTAKIHLDGVIKKPSVSLDGKLIIRKGKFLI